MNRKVLIVTYYWPPSGGVGTQRWMHFSRELQKNGWEPIIYTPSNPQFSIKDEALLEKVKNIPVYKTTIWEPFDLFHALTGNRERGQVKQGLVMEKAKPSLKDRLIVWIRGNLMVPDPRRFWANKSARFLSRLVEEENIGTIITTGPPHSMHLIGRKVKKRTNVRWIADFRDPWSAWDVLPKLKTGKWAMAAHRRLERKVLQLADRVLTVSSQLQKDLSEKGNREVDLLHNGVSLSKGKPKSQPALTMGYFGMLNEIRNPTSLWNALDELCSNNERFQKDFQLRIGGIISDSIQSEVNALPGLGKRVKWLDYLAHDDLQEAYAQCDVLLLLLNRSDNARWILPVKFFEYLSANRQILALGPADSDLAKLMNNQGVGELIAFEDVDALSKWLSAWGDGKLSNESSNIDHILARFSHETLTKKLISYLENDKD